MDAVVEADSTTVPIGAGTLGETGRYRGNHLCCQNRTRAGDIGFNAIPTQSQEGVAEPSDPLDAVRCADVISIGRNGGAS